MKIDAVKTVVRCRDIEASRRFYTEILELRVTDEWDQEEGKGVIVAAQGDRGYIELCVPPEGRDDEQHLHAQQVGSDKIEIQLRVPSLEECIARLEGRWGYEGPVERPWGHTYIWLRDPDNLRIAVYEEER